MATDENPVVNVVNGVASVQPDPLRFRRDRGAVVITWEVAAGSLFRFKRIQPGRPGGIHIDSESGRPGRDAAHIDAEFHGGNVIADGRKFQLVNRNSRAGSYKYSVRLIGPGNVELTLDPAIINMD
jgi:hypothetical protein